MECLRGEVEMIRCTMYVHDEASDYISISI